MALEPISFSVESMDEVNPEYVDMRRRFWWSVPPSAVLLGLMFFGAHLAWLEAGAGDPGGAVGGMAAVRARLGVGRESQLEHVHADRLWGRARRMSTA